MSELRFKLVLGKFPVVKIERGFMTLKLAGTTEAKIALPDHADVRDGDLLTLYTEVLLKPPQG